MTQRCLTWLAVAVVSSGLTLCSSTGLAAHDLRAVLALRVNLRDQGEIRVLLREGDVLARMADLEQAGLQDVAGQREVVAGEPYVSLASLAPTLTYGLDEQTLTLHLTVSPVLLPATVLNLRSDRPPGITYSQDTSAFLNYALNVSDFGRVDAFGEAGLSLAGTLLTSSFSRTAEGAFIRGLTSLTLDERVRLRRWVLGDHFANTGLLGGGAFLGGLSVSREFTLDPYLFRYPGVGLSGALPTPSTLDLYVNGAFVRREPLPPGPFTLQNLPLVAGSGATRLVIRDAFGREQEVTTPYYFSTGLLAPGRSEYSYNLGFQRQHTGTARGDYGSLAFLGRHRVGLTETLTAGVRLEGSPKLLSGGPSVTMRVPLGTVDLAIAASLADGGGGGAAVLAYSYLGRAVGFSAFTQVMSARYATVGLAPAQDRALLEAGASVSVPLGTRLSLSLQYKGTDWRDRGWTHRVGVLSSIRLMERASLLVSATHLQGKQGGADNEFFAGVTYAFDRGITGSLFAQQSGGKTSSVMQVQQSPPLGPGFGYRVQGEVGAQNQGSGLLRYQGDYGIYEASYGRVNDQNTVTLSTSGSLVAIGGRVYPSRPVSESFALIRVPGVPGVPGYVSNQEVGRTDARGDLVVPNLLSYYGNRIAIGAAEVPLEYAIDITEHIVAPPFRGGALVTFSAQRGQHVTGTLVVDVAGQSVIPAYGQLTVMVESTQVSSPLGKGGEFYLEHLAGGHYPATVEYAGGRCQWTLAVPVADTPFVQLGTLHCVIP